MKRDIYFSIHGEDAAGYRLTIYHYEPCMQPPDPKVPALTISPGYPKEFDTWEELQAAVEAERA